MARSEKESDSDEHNSPYLSGRGSSKRSRASKSTNEVRKKISDNAAMTMNLDNLYKANHSLNAKQVNSITNHPFEYKCQFCSFSSDRPSYTERHLKMHAAKPRYTCDQCDYYSHLRDSLKRHLRTHKPQKSFKCTDCSYAGYRMSDLCTHYRLKHLENQISKKDIIQCKRPTSPVLDQTILLKTTEDDSDEFDVNALCEVQFMEEDSLPTNGTAMEGTTHVKHEVQLIREDDTPRFVCEVCTQPVEPKEAPKLVKKEFPVTDDINETSAADNAVTELKEETSEQNDEAATSGNDEAATSGNDEAATSGNDEAATSGSQFCCDHCNYSTNFRGILMRHKRTHLKQQQIKLYKCDKPSCDYVGQSENNLKRHYRTKHDVVNDETETKPVIRGLSEANRIAVKCKSKSNLKQEQLVPCEKSEEQILTDTLICEKWTVTKRNSAHSVEDNHSREKCNFSCQSKEMVHDEYSKLDPDLSCSQSKKSKVKT